MQDGVVRARSNREVRTQFANIDGLGAAAGQGFSVHQPRLPGISGESPSAKTTGTVAAITGAPAAGTTVSGSSEVSRKRVGRKGVGLKGVGRIDTT